jgi:hypothetical protein
VPPLGKGAGQKCQHQRYRTGCVVYHKAGMPPECAIWNCRWLVEDDTAELPRPDRAHYVIDIMPDFITWAVDDERHNVEVVQIWIDPKWPNAHHDLALRRYLLRRGEEGKVALIRLNSKEAFTLIPPNMASDQQWHEVYANVPSERTHTFTEIAKALE